MMKSPVPFTGIELPAESRERLIALLNRHLADTNDLQSQVKQSHWNVKGVHFYVLHRLFDEITGELDEFADEFAERVAVLGGLAAGTVRMAAEASTLPELPIDTVDGLDLVRALTGRFRGYAGNIRKAIDESNGMGDPTTADLFTEISRTTDKRLWFLEAHLQPTP